MASAAAAPYLIPLLSSIAFGAVSGATSPSNRNESFGAGRSLNALNDFDRTLREAFSGINDYTSRDVSFPDATVQGLPTFSGGGLPMPIGTLAQPGTLSQPPTMKGINFRGTPLPSSVPPPDTASNPTNPGTGPGTGESGGPSGGDPSGGSNPPQKDAVPGAQRQRFTDPSQSSPSLSMSPSMPYAQLPYSTLGRSSTGQQSDPTHAALSLLYHAAGM